MFDRLSCIYALRKACPVNPAVTGFAPVFVFTALAAKKGSPGHDTASDGSLKRVHKPGYLTRGARMQLLPEKQDMFLYHKY
jgi:hypothetical protein